MAYVGNPCVWGGGVALVIVTLMGLTQPADPPADEEKSGKPARSAPAQQGPPPAAVRVDEARMETVERWREVTGELRSVRRATVAAEQQGQVLELAVEPGDHVEQGQLLARLDDVLAQLEAERARATVRTREAIITERSVAWEKAKRDLQRIEDSYSRAGASQIELDDIRTSIANAESRVAQARSELAYAQSDVRLAEKRLADMVINAPFAGVVVAKRSEVGQWVSEGDSVVELVALDALDAWLDVPEAFAARLIPKNGAPIEVVLRIPAMRAVGVETERRAAVSSVIPAADPLSRLFPVRARLANAGAAGVPGSTGPLRPGMTVVGLVPTGEPHQALTVHRDAVLRNESGSFVYINAGGVAAIAPVRVEFASGDRVVVQSPLLKAGSQVIIEGNERMYPGRPLKIQNTPPPAADTPATPAAARSATGSR